MKVTKKIIFIILIILIVIIIGSHIFIPNSIEIDGGSCYQGIMSGISTFFLIICGIFSLLSLVALLYNTKIKTAKVLSIISTIIWSLWSFLIMNYKITGLLYIIPFLTVTILIIIVNNKYLKVEKK
jgi:hypothetical protein